MSHQRKLVAVFVSGQGYNGNMRLSLLVTEMALGVLLGLNLRVGVFVGEQRGKDMGDRMTR